MPSFSKLKQIKELRTQAKQMQNKLSEEEVTVDHRGVSITMDGNQKIKNINIKEELLAPNKKSDLEKNIIKTYEHTIKKIHKIMATQIKDSGIDFPGMK